MPKRWMDPLPLATLAITFVLCFFFSLCRLWNRERARRSKPGEPHTVNRERTLPCLRSFVCRSLSSLSPSPLSCWFLRSIPAGLATPLTLGLLACFLRCFLPVSPLLLPPLLLLLWGLSCSRSSASASTRRRSRPSPGALTSTGFWPLGAGRRIAASASGTARPRPGSAASTQGPR